MLGHTSRNIVVSHMVATMERTFGTPFQAPSLFVVMPDVQANSEPSALAAVVTPSSAADATASAANSSAAPLTATEPSHPTIPTVPAWQPMLAAYFAALRQPKPTLRNALDLIRFDRPAGTLLLLWPTLSALWLAAGGFPGWKLLLVFGLGTLLMRSAGCCINDIADRHFDRHVKRTANRPVTSGRVNVAQAATLAALLCLLAFVLVCLTNQLTVLLSLAGLAVTLLYPYTKRWLSLPQAVLGVAFSFGIPMAFSAVHNQLFWEAWVMLLINGYWVLAYDTIYAMVDRDDDLKIGIKTSAITFGERDVGMVLTCLWMFLAGLTALGFHFELHAPYYLGIAAASLLVLWQYRLIRHRERDACFRAFKQSHWMGFAVFAGMVAEFHWYAR